ncbi:MAG: DUF411 domain-containing protein [Gemmatimonas sp.]
MNHASTGSLAARDRSGLSADLSVASASRRDFLSLIAKAAGVLVTAPLLATQLRAETSHAMSAVGGMAMKVYKDPNCGCCKAWIKHMQAAGFLVTSEDTLKMDAIKIKLGVPSTLGSCHTAVVGDYLVEGHVPADLVQKMLKDKPNARGLAVPGMPQGSPGMEGPTKDKYNVMLFDRLGRATVYASR